MNICVIRQNLIRTIFLFLLISFIVTLFAIPKLIRERPVINDGETRSFRGKTIAQLQVTFSQTSSSIPTAAMLLDSLQPLRQCLEPSDSRAGLALSLSMAIRITHKHRLNIISYTFLIEYAVHLHICSTLYTLSWPYVQERCWLLNWRSSRRVWKQYFHPTVLECICFRVKW